MNVDILYGSVPQPHLLSLRDALPATEDIYTADPCSPCRALVPWSDVVSGASERVRTSYRDIRLCAACTAERTR